MLSLVIILVIDGISVLPKELKCDPPVPAYRHRPTTLPITLERMKIQPGKRHIFRSGGRIQTAQNKAQPFSVLCLDASSGPGLEELAQTFVLEAVDHCEDCNQTRYGLQDGQQLPRVFKCLGSE